MTLQEWEKKLKKYLSPLPKSEQNRIVEYYREMYGDKIDNGCSEAEILAEFGDPQVCAGRMISENADTEEQEEPIFAPIKEPKQPKQPQQAQSGQQSQPTGNPYAGNPYMGNPYLASAAGANINGTNPTPPVAQTATDKAKKSPSVGAVIGWIFFTLLIGIPVMAVIISVIASFGAVFISGIAVAVAGAVFAVASLFFGIFGVPASGIFASLGLGLAASGVGILLAIGFYFATKYTAIYTFKGVRWLYAGRKKQ